LSNARKRHHFLTLTDLNADEFEALFELAGRSKRGDIRGRPLAGRTLAMVFSKSSTRTRVSFEVGMFQLGGHALFLSSRDIQLGRGETLADTARVLSRYVDGIMVRTHAHREVEELADHATVPVVNGLTDRVHPCQVLADLMTVREEFGADLSGLRVAWIGDGNNMANSWLNASRRLGFGLRLACPEGYEPDPELREAAEESSDVELVRDPADAVEGAHVVSTDVWASMGHEGEAETRRQALGSYRVTGGLMRRAAPDAIFLHCLPAHRGEEVDAEVIDGDRSRVWEEAENRLHVQKALLILLMLGDTYVE
jgi:ornithine carbamoyltransferase